MFIFTGCKPIQGAVIPDTHAQQASALETYKLAATQSPCKIGEHIANATFHSVDLSVPGEDPKFLIYMSFAGEMTQYFCPASLSVASKADGTFAPTVKGWTVLFASHGNSCIDLPPRNLPLTDRKTFDSNSTTSEEDLENTLASGILTAESDRTSGICGDAKNAIDQYERVDESGTYQGKRNVWVFRRDFTSKKIVCAGNIQLDTKAQIGPRTDADSQAVADNTYGGKFVGWIELETPNQSCQ